MLLNLQQWYANNMIVHYHRMNLRTNILLYNWLLIRLLSTSGASKSTTVIFSQYVYEWHLQFLQNKEKDIYAEQSPYLAPATKQEDSYAQIKSYSIMSIPREEVEWV